MAEDDDDLGPRGVVCVIGDPDNLGPRGVGLNAVEPAVPHLDVADRQRSDPDLKRSSHQRS